MGDSAYPIDRGSTTPVVVAVVIDDAEDHERTERTTAIALESAIAAVGREHVILTGSTEYASVAECHGVAWAESDGTPLDGLERAIARAEGRPLFYCAASTAVIPGAVQRAASRLTERVAWVRGAEWSNTSGAAEPPRTPIDHPRPGDLIATTALVDVGARAGVVGAIRSALRHGWSSVDVGPTVAVIGDTTPTAQLRRDAWNRAAVLHSSWVSVRGRGEFAERHTLGSSTTSDLTDLCRSVLLLVCWLVFAASLAALDVAKGWGVVDVLTGGAIAGACLAMIGARPSRRRGLADTVRCVDVSVLALASLGSGRIARVRMRPRVRIHPRAGWQAVLGRPISTAVTVLLEGAVVIAAIRLASSEVAAWGRTWWGIGMVSASLMLIVPLLGSLGIVVRARPRRASTRRPLELDVWIECRDGRSSAARIRDISVDGLAIDTEHPIEDDELVVRFPSERSGLRMAVVRRSRRASTTTLGLTVHPEADHRGRASLVRWWLHATERLAAVHRADSGSEFANARVDASPRSNTRDVVTMGPTAGRVGWQFGGSKAVRLTTAATMVALGVAVAPPYPASFAAPPPVSGPDATWWVQPFAGGYEVGNGLPAAQATFFAPNGGAYDPAGNLYVADRAHHQIRRIAPDGTVTAFAGTGVLGFSGDGGPATAAELNFPHDVTWADGALYIADTSNHRIRKVASDGTITTVAGTGVNGTPRSGMAATFTPLGNPIGLDTDPSGRVVIARQASQVLRLEPNGTISLLAGSASATSGFAGDGGPATAALFATIRDVAVGPDGSIVVLSNDRLRRFTPGGNISTIAGTGVAGFSGDGGAATAAQVDPMGVDIAPDGTIYVAEVGNDRIRRITPGGVISTVAGTGVLGSSGDGGAATAARLNDPLGVVVDPGGTITVLDTSNRRLRRVTVGGNIVAFAGVQGLRGRSSGLGGPAVAAGLANAEGLAVGPDGSVYIADRLSNQVKRVDPAGTITLFAGTGVAGGTGDGGPATAARLHGPREVAVGPDGSVYIVEITGHRIRRVSPSGTISRVAGTGTAGSAGDGGPATSAQLNQPSGIAVAGDGTLYIADLSNHRIRMVSPSGIISTFAGPSGAVVSGFAGDGGSRTSALFNAPVSITLSSSGTLYITDSVNNRVRAINPSGIVTTVAGNGSATYGGDGGAATSAGMSSPSNVTVAPDGALWISTANGRVRRVAADGTVSTVFGASGTASWATGLPASAVPAGRPWDVAFQLDGTPLVSDVTLYTVVAMVPPPGPPTDVVVTASTATTATIGWAAPDAAPFTVNGYSVTSTPAARVTITGTTATLHDLRPNTTYTVSVTARVGRGTTAAATATVTTQPDPTAAGQTVIHVAGGLRPDGPMPAGSAPLANALTGVAEGDSGAIYATSWNQVWRIDPDGTAQVIAGVGPQGTGVAGFSGDGGPARTAMLNTPRGLVWSGGVLYVADTANNRIRAITADGTISTVGGNGSTTWAGDGSLAVATGFNRPNDVAVDSSGRLIVSLGTGARIVRIETNGTVTTLAGTGIVGSAGDGGPATAANIEPMGIAIAADGGILLAQLNNDRIRRVAPDGTISTVAGNGTDGRGGDGGPATTAQLEYAWDIATFPDGSFVIADGNRIRTVAPDGTITRTAGTGGQIPTALDLDPLDSAVSGARNLITRADGSIVYTELLAGRIVSLHNGVRTLIAGGGDSVLGSGGPASEAVIGRSNTLALADDGSLLFGQELGGTVQRIDPSGIISTVAGDGTLDGAPIDPAGIPALSHSFSTPIGMVADGDGGYYVGDWLRILHLDAAGTLTQVAGGTWSADPMVGLGGPASAVPMGKVRSIAIAPDGALVYADGDQHAIKRIGLDGNVTLVAGTGFAGYNGDDIPAIEAAVNEPSHLAFDAVGRLWFSDRRNHRLRMIDDAGIIHTMAGTGYSGVDPDGLPATQSRLSEPYGFAFDGETVVIANYGSNRISRLRADGTLVTIAGNGAAAAGPESALPLGHPLDTTVTGPVAVVVLPSGSIVWTENQTMRIRAIPVTPAPPTSLTVVSERNGVVELNVDVDLGPGERLVASATPDASITVDGSRISIAGLPAGAPSTVEVTVVDRFASSGPIAVSVTPTDAPLVNGAAVTVLGPTSASITAQITSNGSPTAATVAIRSATDRHNDGRAFDMGVEPLLATETAAASVALSGLQPGTEYEAEIRATNGDGSGSSTVRFVTPTASTPNAPSTPTSTGDPAPPGDATSPDSPASPMAGGNRPGAPGAAAPSATPQTTSRPAPTTIPGSATSTTSVGPGPSGTRGTTAHGLVASWASSESSGDTPPELTVRGAAPFSSIRVSLGADGPLLAEVTADADGNARFTLDGANDLPSGEHTIVIASRSPEGSVERTELVLTVHRHTTAAAAAPSRPVVMATSVAVEPTEDLGRSRWISAAIFTGFAVVAALVAGGSVRRRRRRRAV